MFSRKPRTYLSEAPLLPRVFLHPDHVPFSRRPPTCQRPAHPSTTSGLVTCSCQLASSLSLAPEAACSGMDLE